MRKSPLERKNILNPAEAVEYYTLSSRKMRALLNTSKELNFLLQYGKRKLIVKALFEPYLAEHPELKRRKPYVKPT